MKVEIQASRIPAAQVAHRRRPPHAPPVSRKVARYWQMR